MSQGERRVGNDGKARPREIIEAAKAVFAHKGYDATRMADVAGLAGVTNGTIYLYFKNKQHLYEAVSPGAFTA